MEILIIVVILVGAIVTYFVARAPHRTVRLMEESQAKAKRTELLTIALENLKETVGQTRSVVIAGAQRSEPGFTLDELDRLRQHRASCAEVLPVLKRASPILARYVENHIAVIAYLLGETGDDVNWNERLRNAIEAIDRFLAAQNSDHPIAVMERRLATGQDL